MKKYFLVAFALFAVISNVKCDSSKRVLEEVKSKYLEEFLSRYNENIERNVEKLEGACPGVVEKLRQARLSSPDCGKDADDSLTLCQIIQIYTLNCTRPFVKVVDDCMSPEKGFAAFSVESLVSIISYLCKQSGETIFELANPCLWQDTQGEENHACEEKVEEIFEKYVKSKNPPSRIEACSTLTGLRGCIQAHATTSCKNQKTRNAITGLFDAAVAPCRQIPEENLSSIPNNFL